MANLLDYNGAGSTNVYLWGYNGPGCTNGFYGTTMDMGEPINIFLTPTHLVIIITNLGMNGEDLDSLSWLGKTQWHLIYVKYRLQINIWYETSHGIITDHFCINISVSIF